MFNALEKTTEENLDTMLATAQESDEPRPAIEDLFPEHHHTGAPQVIQLSRKKRDDEDPELDEEELLRNDPEVQMLQQLFAQAV